MFRLLVLVNVQQDDISNRTVGCVVFVFTDFHSVIFHQFYGKLQVTNKFVIHGKNQVGLKKLFVSLHSLSYKVCLK